MSMLGTVGPPFVFTEVRLEEVPEMGYDPLGDPSRGEICVRGRTAFTGYYKNPELTREVIKDGWFHTGWSVYIYCMLRMLFLFHYEISLYIIYFILWAYPGDIGEMLPNGVVKIIDRKKNVIKLSQGEYVAMEYLEKVYGIAPIIEDVSTIISFEFLKSLFIWIIMFLRAMHVSLICVLTDMGIWGQLQVHVGGGCGATRREHQKMGRSKWTQGFNSWTLFSPRAESIYPPWAENCCRKEQGQENTIFSQFFNDATSFKSFRVVLEKWLIYPTSTKTS